METLPQLRQLFRHLEWADAEINARLRELGGGPPLVDYITWVWFGRPAPDWSTAAGTA